MLNLSDAKKVLKQQLPNYAIIRIFEYDTCFAFNVYPEGCEGFANGCCYVVKKDSGEHGWVPIIDMYQLKPINIYDEGDSK